MQRKFNNNLFYLGCVLPVLILKNFHLKFFNLFKLKKQNSIFNSVFTHKLTNETCFFLIKLK